MLPAGDAELIRIVDAALQDAVQRSGNWLACRPGCNQCCTGVFRISQLDAARLRQGLALLQQANTEQAHRVQARVAESRERLSATFPGDCWTGLLHEGDEANAAFDDFGNEEVCPVLDPVMGTCSLYAHRPMTCRTFGPPVRTEQDALGTCELCFQDATEQEVARAEMHLPPLELEAELSRATGYEGETVVAFAFAPGSS